MNLKPTTVLTHYFGNNEKGTGPFMWQNIKPLILNLRSQSLARHLRIRLCLTNQ